MTPIWEQFISFCRQELATGGPDPQIALIAELSKNSPDVDRAWLAGCYGAHHCVPSAYVVWTAFPEPEDVKQYELEDFLSQHWDALPVRPEMRSHRMVEKRAKCLFDFAQFAASHHGRGNGVLWHSGLNYEEVWSSSIANVKYYNRYMAIKFLEMLRRMVAPGLALNSLRAKNAWSPRRTLYMLWPHPDLENEHDPRDWVLDAVESAFTLTRHELRRAGVYVTGFQLQVMLCEFREALNGTYYCGASHDEELDFIIAMEKAEENYDLSPIYAARAQLFPHSALGELNGWHGVRQEMFKEFTV